MVRSPARTQAPSLTLRVAEALPKDVGRGMARLDPGDIERLGASIGDVVAIAGQRTTALKLMPAYLDERGKQLIQIDGIARENAGVGLDDRVHVEMAAIQDAGKVALAPIGPSRLSQQARDASYVGRLVDGLVVQVGDRVRVNLFGSRPQDFTVTR